MKIYDFMSISGVGGGGSVKLYNLFMGAFHLICNFSVFWYILRLENEGKITIIMQSSSQDWH